MPRKYIKLIQIINIVRKFRKLKNRKNGSRIKLNNFVEHDKVNISWDSNIDHSNAIVYEIYIMNNTGG